MAVRLKDERYVIYLYGFTESPPRKLPELIGVDRLSRVESIDCDGVCCCISRVPQAEFETNLVYKIEDLDWLAETSVTHQRVISAIAAETEILPERLGSIFHTENSLSTHVLGRLPELKSDLVRIRGADQWGVNVFEVQPMGAPFAKIRKGKIPNGKDDWRASAEMLRARQSSDDVGAIEELERALRGIATEVAPSGNVSCGQRGLRFQTTLLVRRSRRKKLESLLQKFARLWAAERRIECTGPWPPYSFVTHPENGMEARSRRIFATDDPGGEMSLIFSIALNPG
jgi:hypothetical protein